MELDTCLNVLNYTLVHTMVAVTHLRFTSVILKDMHTGIQQLIVGIISLRQNMDSLYEYMKALLVTP